MILKDILKSRSCFYSLFSIVTFQSSQFIFFVVFVNPKKLTWVKKTSKKCNIKAQFVSLLNLVQASNLTIYLDISVEKTCSSIVSLIF